MRICLIIISLCFASPVFAQGQIIDFALREMQQQIDREQQRQFQREQQQQNQRNWQLYVSMWQDCFNNRVKQRCLDALAYPNINATDSNKLRAQYQLIEQYEQSQRDAEQYRQQEAIRQREAEERAERQRQADEAQRVENERRAREAEYQRRIEEARRTEQERRKTQERQAAEYHSAVSDCRRFVVSGCNAALASPLLTTADEPDLRSWRNTSDAYGNDKQACRSGDPAACARAIASPVADDTGQLLAWRADASAYYRLLGWYEASRDTSFAYASASWRATSDFALASWTAVRDLPTSTHVAGTVAALSLAVAGIALRSNRTRGTEPPAAPKAAETPAEPTAGAPFEQPLAPPPLPDAVVACDPPPVPPPIPNLPAVIEPPPAVVIDTPAAMRAMALAHAYLLECEPSTEPGADNRPHRTTLSLAARQLDIAQQADPNARFEDKDGRTWRLPQLRCRVLLKEAMTHAADNIGKACALAETACAHDPDSAYAHFLAGCFNYEHKNRDAAVEHLTRSAQLDPDDIETLKLLDRAQNMSVTEIATYKTQHAGLKVANAGVKVYNTGVGIYNVGVFFWNIFAYTWRVFTFPMRVMDRIFGFIFR